ncbi:hypothetical protein [Streptomonospora alba]|uniref:hypothetical protein n=1 Tax=Streptomonospora alba TaxID=183763 RepID=UPI00187DA124|nr:hypothetical protein [Streptomonospora alba]
MEQQEASPTRASSGTGVLGGVVPAAVTVALAAWAWNADVPSPVAHRVFLVVWGLGGLLLAGEHLSRGGRVGVRIATAGHVFYLGLLAGAALGTTAWSQLGAVFWYQLWWSGPLATALTLAVWERHRIGAAGSRSNGRRDSRM